MSHDDRQALGDSFWMTQEWMALTYQMPARTMVAMERAQANDNRVQPGASRC